MLHANLYDIVNQLLLISPFKLKSAITRNTVKSGEWIGTREKQGKYVFSKILGNPVTFMSEFGFPLLCMWNERETIWENDCKNTLK